MDKQSGYIESNKLAAGAYAVLGVDVVSFSKLEDEDQVEVIKTLMRYIKESLLFRGQKETDSRWSPAGDGGYLTFVNPQAGKFAIDVAFSIFERVAGAEGSSVKFSIRAALHAGTVREEADLGRDTNIWGMGINTTARILSVSDQSQLLVSRQYFDTYMKDRRESGYVFGEPYFRTVKHNVFVEVMNVSKPGSPCLNSDAAGGMRWRYLGGLWHKTVEEYQFLISDTMRSDDPVAAIAAAKYLLEMAEEYTAKQLCKMLTQAEADPECNYPPRRHPLFSSMPPDVLLDVVRNITPRVVKADEIICEDGTEAESCFFPVSGQIVVDVPGREGSSPIRKGQILGEFSLWIPNLKRTATIRSLDPGLVLELEHRKLATVLQQHPEVATVVYSLIQRRIVENVLRSPLIFPGLEKLVNEKPSSFGAACKKVAAGGTLDLRQDAFILLIGKVRIHCANGAVLEIVAEGRFDVLPVVGIYTAIAKPDGDTAEVLEDTVAVQVSHAVLADLHKRFPTVAKQWGALYGQRLYEAHMSQTDIPPK
jgi:CRP-like cAMP-binding protein